VPELPEVEVAARNLRRWAVGRKIRMAQAERGAAYKYRRALDAVRTAHAKECGCRIDRASGCDDRSAAMAWIEARRWSTAADLYYRMGTD